MVALSREGGQRTARAFCPGLLRVFCGCLAVAGLLTGCARVITPEAPPEPPTTRAPAEAPAPPAKKATKSPPPEPAAQPEPAPAPIAVLFAEGVPAYRNIAEELLTRARHRAYALPLAKGAAPSPADIPAKHRVVAIGVLAARIAAGLSDQPFVYCQVFNVRAHGLEEPRMLGVSMLPPARMQFAAWRALAPDVKRIGVILGPGHDDLILEAETAARESGLELIVRTARTDKETLFEFKRLVPEIDGFWLLPDERVLSHRVLRELMAYSAQHETRILAFSPELLKFGALMSASSVDADVVDQLLAAVDGRTPQTLGPGFRLLPLTDVEIEVNAELARRLGYGTAASARRDDAHVR